MRRKFVNGPGESHDESREELLQDLASLGEPTDERSIEPDSLQPLSEPHELSAAASLAQIPYAFGEFTPEQMARLHEVAVTKLEEDVKSTAAVTVYALAKADALKSDAAHSEQLARKLRYENDREEAIGNDTKWFGQVTRRFLMPFFSFLLLAAAVLVLIVGAWREIQGTGSINLWLALGLGVAGLLLGVLPERIAIFVSRLR